MDAAPPARDERRRLLNAAAPTLRRSQAQVLDVINACVDYWNTGPWTWPKVEMIVERTRLSVRAVQVALRDLVAEAVLDSIEQFEPRDGFKQGRQKPTKYAIDWEVLAPRCPPSDEPLEAGPTAAAMGAAPAPQGRTGCTRGAQELRLTGAGAAHPYVENEKPKEKNTPAAGVRWLQLLMARLHDMPDRPIFRYQPSPADVEQADALLAEIERHGEDPAAAIPAIVERVRAAWAPKRCERFAGAVRTIQAYVARLANRKAATARADAEQREARKASAAAETRRDAEGAAAAEWRALDPAEQARWLAAAEAFYAGAPAAAKRPAIVEGKAVQLWRERR